MPHTLQFRVCLAIRPRDELDEVYEKIVRRPHVCGSVFRNRRNKELLMAHLIWKVDTRSISNIEHRNVATVAGIFYGCHNGLFEVILLQQHAELTLDQLPQLNEVELSSSCDQLVDGFRYLASTRPPFLVEDVRVNLSGTLKIVLDFRHKCDYISSTAVDYWHTQYTDRAERLFSLQTNENLSSLGVQFYWVAWEQGMPSAEHEFLSQSRGPKGLQSAVARAVALLLHRRS
ncbi:hypothetical protein B0J13DRAFT_568081 [Dactylonectria estremocensis]|uniref:Uncharacterized protein n=1 Tax=Dactylonectria estremocensis TaxID=1079267 RepID=A0A9P9IHB5_9HYPO|nr:hypothetical protein B0J13DRAFT_568081 [Dactylonectria estremocensis]